MIDLETIPKVNDFFPLVDGVVSHIDYDFEVINVAKLEVLFITNYGDRSVAPVASRLVSGNTPTEEELTKIASLLKSYYSVKWDNLKNVYLIDYDPIHNYMDELTETIKDNGTGKSKISATASNESSQDGTANNTRVDDLAEKRSGKSESTDVSHGDNSIYGFNSTTDSPSDKNALTDATTESNSSLKENTGRQTNASTTINHSSSSDEETRNTETEEENNRVRTSTHSGNIGNLTTQQLLKQEIELRQWNFINSVLEDIKEFLTLPIYL